MKNNEVLPLWKIILISVLGNRFPYLPSYLQLGISIALNLYLLWYFIREKKLTKDIKIYNQLWCSVFIGAISLFIYVLFSKYLVIPSNYLKGILILNGMLILYFIIRIMYRFKKIDYILYKELMKKLRFLLILAIIIVIPAIVIVYSVVSKK